MQHLGRQFDDVHRVGGPSNLCRNVFDARRFEAQQIIDHCHTLIANYKCPRKVEFRDDLPPSGGGKIMKNVLRDPYWAGKTRSVN